ncbi:MAG: Ig-like domain-containing protein, partial [Duncaniella sp.]|nr:Ig-like domain-containing protein [Duncaniella sp.]
PEAPDGETLVTISFYARDDKSGLGKCTYRLRDPQGTDHFEYYYHRNFYSLYFDGDPTVWEHYLIKVVLPQGSAPGIWGLAQMTVADKAFNEYTYNFVETLIFEPDNDISGYELFADIEDSSLIFHVNAQDDSPVSYKWRVIHEESGLEICGDSNSGAKSRAKNVSESESNNNEIRADISNLPKGDLILIVEVRGEDGNILSVKTKRVAYIETVIPVESITLSSNEWTGVVGSSFQLTATVLPENATDKTIVWSSSDETVATVDSEGKVMTLKVGEADIVAVCDTISSKCHVKVNPILAESIELDPSSWIGFVGESFSITATVSPENTTDKTIVWSSSDETVATVDSEGKVITLTVGEAFITAACGTSESSCHVIINPILVESIQLDPYTWSGNIGENFRITATVLPENASDKTLVWSTSDETIATVTSDGLVNITGSGLCTVRATSCDGSNIYAECSILTDQSGIDVIFNDQNDVDVYNMKGYLVKKQCGKSDFLLLEPGVYILRFGKVTKTILKK